MDKYEAFLRFITGGALILLVSLLSTTKFKIISGILVLFPIVTVVGFYAASFEMNVEELRKSVLLGMIGLPTVFSFLITFYFSLKIFSVTYSLIMGLLAWLLTAVIIVLLSLYVFKIINI